MKKNLSFLLFLLLFSGISCSGAARAAVDPQTDKQELVAASGLDDRLSSLSGDIVSVEPIEKGQFNEKWIVTIKQPLDYRNLSIGTFNQRFIVCHRGFDRPTVFVTEGYRGDYALRPTYMDELAKHYDANVIVVEHRYFSGSVPSPRNWDYLTVEASMNDLHRINRTMRDFYTRSKWIATGISKGGMTTIMYKTYFPDDTDVAVPYVAPVCFGVEDGRHEPFIDRCGTPEQRTKIRDFQTEVLKRRDEVRPLFEKFCNDRKLKFVVPLDEAYDYCVLEYSFAFWQWGTSTDRIPVSGAPAQEVLDHLMSVAGADYFAVNPEPSFYVQAALELGYYGYDVRPFKGLLTIKSAKGYLHRIMLPEDAKKVKYSKQVARDIYAYLKKNDPKMICVYGEFDPWSAVALEPELFKGKQNMLLLVGPGGSHRTRIATLPAEMQKEAWGRIDKWLNE